MEFYQVDNQYSTPSISNTKVDVHLNPTASSSNTLRKRKYDKTAAEGGKPKSLVVLKRQKDVLSSIPPSSMHYNDQNIKNLLQFFSHSNTRESSPFNQGRGRPTDKSKNSAISDNMIEIPADRCAYKKHKSEDRIQRLWIFFPNNQSEKGHEYGYYTKSKDEDAAIVHGFYCMGCTNIRKKREFDALINVDRNGLETFMAKHHVEGCQPRDNNGQYMVKIANPAINSLSSHASSSTTPTMNEFAIQNMVRQAIQESFSSMLEQVQSIVREEVALQFQALNNNNFEQNY